MKFVVIGGSGLIGSKVVGKLRKLGHEAVSATPSSGVNIVTGEGLAEVVAGAEVVIDVANSPTFEAGPAMAFFESAGRNLRAAERAAGVRHHVALSVVGTERLLESGYFRAKMAQEEMIQGFGIPYSIVRATQFFEFIGAIAQSGTVMEGGRELVRLPSAMMQPIASGDVAAAVVDVALGAPANGIVEVAGPEPIAIDEIVRRLLAAQEDPREVVTDDRAPYFGLKLERMSLMPGPGARIGAARFGEWLGRTVAAPAAGVR